jgi:hypothetical protein
MLGEHAQCVHRAGAVDLGQRCQVISVSPLMRHLLMEAVECRWSTTSKVAMALIDFAA